MNLFDLIAGAISFLLTLMILSYFVGDNPLFKIAAYLFVGVASGYVAAVVFWQALYPKLFAPTAQVLFSGAYNEGLLLVVPWLGVALILMKGSPRLAGASQIPLAFLVGAGAAVILVGALTGTILPQVNAAINVFDFRNNDAGAFEMLTSGAVALVGAVASLTYFHFNARRKADGSTQRFAPIEWLAWIGRVFIAIALGAVFAGVYAAALTAFIERVSSLVIFVKTLLGMS
ncbi:MAG: hypothetical protein LC099_10180 [Anaerolineales bacterium]|nr:hypothetical protein [Anaerolineales bacterium]